MDSGSIGIEIIIVIILIIANGVFSMTELAIINARKGLLEELAEEGSEGAKVAIELGENPNQMFSTIQIGITLISIVTGLYSGATFSDPMARWIKDQIPWWSNYADSMSPVIIVSITTYLSLVIGELVPKRLAYNSPESIAIMMAIPMKYFSRLTAPLVTLLSISTNGLLNLLGVTHKEEAPITESEINKMLTQGVELGAYEKEEPIMVENVFRLADLNAGDVMTPRTQLKWIDLNDSEETIKDILCVPSQYRIPVGEDSLDELKGLISSTDILTGYIHGHQEPLTSLIKASLKEPVFVPESITLMKLLTLFRTEGVHEAVVLDEFGGFSGLVTLHQIMEELIGLMPSGEEEIKEEENRIIQRGEDNWLVDGLISIDELKEYFSIEEILPGEEEDLYKTLGGFITYLIGRIPKEMDVYTWEEYSFEVMDMDHTRVDKVLITYRPKLAEEKEMSM